MALFTLQARINMVTGIPEDAVTNSWCVQADDLTAAVLFCDEIEDLYDTVGGLLSAAVRQNNHELKLYDVDDPMPRAPVYTNVFNLAAAPTGQTMPPEVASCLSFQGVKVSGQPQNRRRGRVFVGPLKTTALDATGRFGAGFMTTLKTAGQDLLVASAAAPSWTWGIHSPLTIGDFVAVNNGWVDNAPDIQRRRGTLATARTVYP